MPVILRQHLDAPALVCPPYDTVATLMLRAAQLSRLQRRPPCSRANTAPARLVQQAHSISHCPNSANKSNPTYELPGAPQALTQPLGETNLIAPAYLFAFPHFFKLTDKICIYFLLSRQIPHLFTLPFCNFFRRTIDKLLIPRVQNLQLLPR